MIIPLLSRISIGASLTTLALLSNGAAIAADFSFRGQFSQDDDVQLFDFAVGSSSTVTLRSYSYAGGVQADGTAIIAGGFDPILSVFDTWGNLLGTNDDGPSEQISADPTTGYAFDVLFEAALPSGDYSVAVSQYRNAAMGAHLSEGFQQSGEGNYTADVCNVSGAFYDTGFQNCAPRTSAWAFDILNVGEAVVIDALAEDSAEASSAEANVSVPEPSAVLALALVTAWGWTTRRQRRDVPVSA